MDLSYNNEDADLPGTSDYTITNGNGIQYSSDSKKTKEDPFTGATPAFSVEIWAYLHSSDDNVELVDFGSDGECRLKYYNNGDLKVKISS